MAYEVLYTQLKLLNLTYSKALILSLTLEKMNIVLLITAMFMLVLVHGSQGVAHKISSDLVSSRYNQPPCQNNNDNNAHRKFVWRHITEESFDKQLNSEG